MKIQFAGCLKNKKRKMADKLHIQTKDEREEWIMDIKQEALKIQKSSV